MGQVETWWLTGRRLAAKAAPVIKGASPLKENSLDRKGVGDQQAAADLSFSRQLMRAAPGAG
jgi:hypothetical protein